MKFDRVKYNPLIVGMTGKAQSGKNYCIKLMRKMMVQEGYNNHIVLELAFADHLKRELYERIFKPDGFDKDFLEQNKLLLRPLIQAYATEYKRNFLGQDIWANLLIRDLAGLKSHLPIIVFITDVRFLNEREALINNDKSTKFIRVLRNDSKDTHISETELDHVPTDYTICNYEDTPVISLHTNIKSIIIDLCKLAEQKVDNAH